MVTRYFYDTTVNIIGNNKLRDPQVEAYIKIVNYFEENPHGEALVVLPTGTGKSGLISIAPYGVANKRVLVITPGLVTKKSAVKTLHPLNDNFWLNYDVLFDVADMPVVEEYEPDMLHSSLEKCHFIISNVQKMQEASKNSLLNRVPPDFFDLIIVDEAHHSVAQSWQKALDYFSGAKVLHLTGTPFRGDDIPLPGKEIHCTSLADVMALKYVKWLRKSTLNNSNLFFTMHQDPKRYSLAEILEIKEREWVEKSVALSKECSMDVIDESIRQLDTLAQLSPDVPHKIMAVACSIAHAEDLSQWYSSKGKRVVIVHSDMQPQELEQQFLKIEDHECDVVVSVNMLMEGYDHKYLTILAIFRPYRSLNAFAQVVGRVLRAIPDEEITDYAIDNNAIVIYHEEIGLDLMWKAFSKEVERSKNIPVKEYEFPDREYIKRVIQYGTIENDDYYVSGTDSFLDNVDFNVLFEKARKAIDDEVQNKAQKFQEAGLEADDIQLVMDSLRGAALRSRRGDLDDILLSKRPELVRKKSRDYLYKNAHEAAAKVLADKGIDPKGSELYSKFNNMIGNLAADTSNDGILVRYINLRLFKKYGPVKEREPETLLQSQKHMEVIVDELRRML